MMTTYIILAVAGLISAVISGLVGMAGGVTLLAAMTLVMPLNVIIPLHGVAQIISNSARSAQLLLPAPQN